MSVGVINLVTSSKFVDIFRSFVQKLLNLVKKAGGLPKYLFVRNVTYELKLVPKSKQESKFLDVQRQVVFWVSLR